MSGNSDPSTSNLSPATLLQMMTGYWTSQAVYVCAKLGIADQLVDGPRTAAELAITAGADAAALHRLLRALASVGVLAETRAGQFALTPLGALLRSGTPDSMRALAIMYCEEQYRSWGDLLYSVRTGQPAFDHVYGMGVFDYFRQNPDAGCVFNEAMSALTNPLGSAVADAYDFSACGTVVDVAGGHGSLIAAVLRNNPKARGILFDLPHVVSGAGEHLAAAGIADRCTSVGGDFFASVPPGGDAYVLKQILHDWDDDRCVAILDQCRRVMSDHSKVLVIEFVLPPGDEPFFGKWLDLHMLVMAPGARERTAAEYEALFKRARLALARVVPTALGLSVVEAAPV